MQDSFSAPKCAQYDRAKLNLRQNGEAYMSTEQVRVNYTVHKSSKQLGQLNLSRS